MKTYVVGGTVDQARNYIHSLPKDEQTNCYVFHSELSLVAKYRSLRIVFVGSYAQRPDYPTIMEYVVSRGYETNQVTFDL